MPGGSSLPGSGHLDDRQHRIHRSPLLFTAPVVLLTALVFMTVWAMVMGNLPQAVRQEWPWRLALLDQEALGSLLAVALGCVFARAQYAQTVRPVIGWRGKVSSSRTGMSSKLVWVVEIRSGGTHNAVAASVEYYVQPRGAETLPADVPWHGYQAAIEELESLGLQIGKDFDINPLGSGFPLSAATDKGLYAACLSIGAISVLDNLYIRLRVTDGVGDTHERILHCLRGAEVEIRSALATDES
ncbi:hypothetical protein [Streptomyces luteogriseus]|uniref:hypothetical protein n=1 Tax=Streptomyces luteogriseus TaxID=68233 RepID=UPI002E2F7FCF|nr:hypothetical protein [Streptomyces luteogriseus]WTJ30414.1 hypothetical protein OID52_26880 [Streptomyces luteogriseus]